MTYRRYAVLTTGEIIRVVAEKLTRDYVIVINGVRSRSVYEENEWEEAAQMMVKNRYGEIEDWRE